jgi:transcription termination/antitermination protein NusG
MFYVPLVEKKTRLKSILKLKSKILILDQYVFQVLIPTEKVYQIRNGKKYHQRKELFAWLRSDRSYLNGRSCSSIEKLAQRDWFSGRQSGQCYSCASIRSKPYFRVQLTYCRSGEEITIPYFVGENC